MAYNWTPLQIVYSTLVGILLLAALLEWVLWVAGFTYCLIKVFQKAGRVSIRIMAILMIIGFLFMRLAFLPVMAVTTPLPKELRGYIPSIFSSVFQWFAFGTYSLLLVVPWLICVYHLVLNNIGKKSRIIGSLDESVAPKVVIVMPCYHEIPEVLITAIDSTVEQDYPQSSIHLFLSFDGSDVDDLYISTLRSLGVSVPLTRYPVSLDVIYKGCRVTISRFIHGGKRHCQKKTFKLIDKVYKSYIKKHDDMFILFIDSDILLDKSCIRNFVYDMQLKYSNRSGASTQDMLAMTGVITCTARKQSFITLLQDIEYVHGQLFERAVESVCGSVTCLPGALTMLRFSAFRRMSEFYFSDDAELAEDLFDFGKCHLGEDRWLTHLFMLGARRRYQIQLCTGAFCKTEAVLTWKSLLKQRRRWFIGFITNEACMLTDIRLWKMYPLLCFVRFMQNTIRTSSLIFFAMLTSFLCQISTLSDIPLGFLAVSLLLNWALMVFFGIRLKRYKAWLYPLMFVFNPIMNWIYMVYGIFTSGQRTWGGPRADAAGDDGVLELSEEEEDGLDVDAGFQDIASIKDGLSVLPSNDVVGQFIPDLSPGLSSTDSSLSLFEEKEEELSEITDTDIASLTVTGIRYDDGRLNMNSTLQIPAAIHQSNIIYNKYNTSKTNITIGNDVNYSTPFSGKRRAALERSVSFSGMATKKVSNNATSLNRGMSTRSTRSIKDANRVKFLEQTREFFGTDETSGIETKTWT
ncbi:glycosyltransferase [Dipodascopsis uninucleata]